MSSASCLETSREREPTILLKQFTFHFGIVLTIRMFFLKSCLNLPLLTFAKSCGLNPSSRLLYIYSCTHLVMASKSQIRQKVERPFNTPHFFLGQCQNNLADDSVRANTIFADKYCKWKNYFVVPSFPFYDLDFQKLQFFIANSQSDAIVKLPRQNIRIWTQDYFFIVTIFYLK